MTAKEYETIRQQPKKIKSKSSSITNEIVWMCPVCGTTVYFNDNYCRKCGQRLDWSDYYGS